MTATSVAAVLHFVDKKSFIQFRKHSWQTKLYIFRNILMIGISPFLMNIAAAGGESTARPILSCIVCGVGLTPLFSPWWRYIL